MRVRLLGGLRGSGDKKSGRDEERQQREREQEECQAHVVFEVGQGFHGIRTVGRNWKREAEAAGMKSFIGVHAL